MIFPLICCLIAHVLHLVWAFEVSLLKRFGDGVEAQRALRRENEVEYEQVGAGLGALQSHSFL